MAPAASATATQSLKIKRPTPAHIQTNGINSSTSSPSPSMSSSRLPGVAKYPPSSAASTGTVGGNPGSRSANRSRKEGQAQLLGRGQRHSSGGLRSASIAAEMGTPHASGPQAYSMLNLELDFRMLMLCSQNGGLYSEEVQRQPAISSDTYAPNSF